MSLGKKENFGTKKSTLFCGIIFSLSSILLAGCASNTKTVSSVSTNKPNTEQAEVHTAVPSQKPVPASKNKASKPKTSKSLTKAYHVEGMPVFGAAEKVYEKVGKASWYGAEFNGRLTANGEVYDMNGLTAAHPTMPLPSYARVTNMENGSSIIVRVNDRGPHVANRVIDLSKQAATMLDYKDNGLATVKIEYVGRAPIEKNDNDYLVASYRPGNITSDTLLAMSGVKLDNAQSSAAQPMNANADMNTIPFDELASPQTITNLPKLPKVGPVVTEKPKEQQWVAFAEEKEQPKASHAFDEALDKTAKTTGSNQTKSQPKAEKNNDNAVNSADSLQKAASFNNTNNTTHALEFAWNTGVNNAFATENR